MLTSCVSADTEIMAAPHRLFLATGNAAFPSPAGQN